MITTTNLRSYCLLLHVQCIYSMPPTLGKFMSRELTPTKHKRTEYSIFWMALVVVTDVVRVSKLHLRVNNDTCMCA